MRAGRKASRAAEQKTTEEEEQQVQTAAAGCRSNGILTSRCNLAEDKKDIRTKRRRRR